MLSHVIYKFTGKNIIKFYSHLKQGENYSDKVQSRE